jgi:multicomponent Na+:H+ antiporter subunit A
MAGLPPFFGFIGKEALYEGALHGQILPGVVAVAALLANAMMIAIAGAVGLNPFIGDRKAAKAEPGDPPLAMWVGPAVLAGCGVAFGIVPEMVDHALIGPMAKSVAGHPVETHLALFHGLNLALGLSLVTFALGYGLWRALPMLRARLIALEGSGIVAGLAQARVPVVSMAFGLIDSILPKRRIARFEDGYDVTIAVLDRAGGNGSAVLQSGIMTRYLRATFAVMAGMILIAFVLAGRLPAINWQPAPVLGLFAALMMTLGTLVLPFTNRRLLKITALGLVGAGVALAFALFGAIDVAVTQLMVETLVVVIIAVALLKLPRIVPSSVTPARVRLANLAVSVAMGLAFALGLAASIEGTLDRSVTDYYEKASATVAYGRNIVNVILVDFRGFDTMGEIAVIAVAGLASLALLAAGGLARVQNQRPEGDR